MDDNHKSRDELLAEIEHLRRRLEDAEQRLNSVGSGGTADRCIRVDERLYRAIGESIDFGVWVCAPDGRNIYASDSFLRVVGLTQEQCSDFGWGDVLHPDDADRIEHVLGYTPHEWLSHPAPMGTLTHPDDIAAARAAEAPGASGACGCTGATQASSPIRSRLEPPFGDSRSRARSPVQSQPGHPSS